MKANDSFFHCAAVRNMKSAFHRDIYFTVAAYSSVLGYQKLWARGMLWHSKSWPPLYQMPTLIWHHNRHQGLLSTKYYWRKKKSKPLMEHKGEALNFVHGCITQPLIAQCRSSSHPTLKKKKSLPFLNELLLPQTYTGFMQAYSLRNCNYILLYIVDSKHFFILLNPCRLYLGWCLKSGCAYNRVNTVFHGNSRLFNAPTATTD